MLGEDKEKNAEELSNILTSLQYMNMSLNLDRVISSSDIAKLSTWQFDNERMESEVKWSRNHEHTSIYHDFSAQLSYVTYSDSGLKGGEELYLKMRFSYAITLMESCLSEMLKSVTMRYEQFKRNAVSKIPELNSSHVKLLDFFDKDPKKLIDNKIMGHLSFILYHNLKKVKSVYEQILGKDISAVDDVLFKKVSDLTEVRHDIVHRNGKKTTGELIEVTPEMVDSCIYSITRFIDGVHNCINEAIRELEEKK
ncbi:HEPN domain-containing protein [Pantoea eucrina]|uniref:HEPN domain-containing protein n=1 Tax=Pantoea eucrina TaxID=472693 RepID=UPI002FD8FC61